jgi:hypothetical protein
MLSQIAVDGRISSDPVEVGYPQGVLGGLVLGINHPGMKLARPKQAIVMGTRPVGLAVLADPPKQHGPIFTGRFVRHITAKGCLARRQKRTSHLILLS